MQVTVELKEAGAVLHVAGDMRVWNHPERATALLEACEQVPDDCLALTLDLSTITYIDSAGIGSLARLRFHCLRLGLAMTAIMPKGAAGLALQSVRILEGCEIGSVAAA